MNVWEWGTKKENKYKKRNVSNCDSKQADINIQYCKNCNRCWELDRTKAFQAVDKRDPERSYCYYPDFPTRGKNIKKCPSCGGR